MTADKRRLALGTITKAAWENMSFYQAKHVLEAAMAVDPGSGYCVHIIESILTGESIISMPDTLFRRLVIDLDWGVAEASLVYHAARRYLLGPGDDKAPV